jgi:hypothetical protein
MLSEERNTSVTHLAHDSEPMQDTQQGGPGVHTRGSSKPFWVYLSDERISNTLQRRNKVVLKTDLEIERITRVEHREQVVENISILLPGDVRECLHRDVILGALEPTDDLLSHLGLVLAISKRTSVPDDGLNSNRRKRCSPATPERTPACTPATS